MTDSLSDINSKNINDVGGNALIFREGFAEKIRENGPKTGNSFVMNIGKRESSDQNFSKLPLLSIFGPLTAILSHFNPPMVKPFRLTYLAKGGGGGGWLPPPS